MRKLLFTLCLMASTGGLVAGPVGRQKAEKVGSRFLAATEIGAKATEIPLHPVATAFDQERGGADYYVFNVKGGAGFVIVAGDDRVKPILAYSTTGRYDPDNVAEGFAFTLNSFCEEIHYVRDHNLKATHDIQAEWKSVMEAGILHQGRQNRSVVGPLCQTFWNQNYPWNSQCPEDPEGSGGHVYAGCVATAMGQIMKFHEWPAQGNGSSTYYPEGYPEQSADFGNTEYHFERMPNTLDSTSTDEQVFHIAQLLHHLGISVDMQYSPDGSGAYGFLASYALRDYFRYNSDEHLTNTGDPNSGWGYNNDEWASMLVSAGLNEHLPLFYTAADDGGAGGHAFVCDGYDENGYFHFNWGWSGHDDAWCPIGALNTTKYAFNSLNGFTGHIIPDNGQYALRPDSVSQMTVNELEGFTGVQLGWTNPSTDLNGDDLTAISAVTIRRNFEVIATIEDAEVGADMTYKDENLEPGLYEYAIFVSNEAGISRTTYRSVLVGEKCPIAFQLHDEGGDGWKGAAISVTDSNGNRIAIITLSEGTQQTQTVPLLKGELNFIWNHGWYHTSPEYDTDGECSFSILDSFGNELFASDTLEDGTFLTFDNHCEENPLTCYSVRQLEGEYYFNNDEDYGAHLTWSRPDITAQLDHFTIYRTLVTYNGDHDLVAEIPYTGSESYEYLDNNAGDWDGGYIYEVTATYAQGEESCESEPMEITIMITAVVEHSGKVSLYPNPTSGQLTINGQGAMRITVSNLLGQKLMETAAENNITLDLSGYQAGFYLVSVRTETGVTVQKLHLRN